MNNVSLARRFGIDDGLQIDHLVMLRLCACLWQPGFYTPHIVGFSFDGEISDCSITYAPRAYTSLSYYMTRTSIVDATSMT